MRHSTPNPTTIVIFGATGDLSWRKLIPALHSLDCEGLLSGDLEVLGVARSQFSDEAFRQHLRQGVDEHGRLRPQVWDDFAQRLAYLRGEYDDPETYRRLGERLERSDNYLFHLAIPQTVYPGVVRRLGEADLNQSQAGWVRLIVEKPFGHDLESARQLNQQLHACFGEEQIYRIDHYLGKETVQNIMTFRFANAIFEPLWSRKYVDHVQISVTESAGVGHRIAYYDQAGVLRDMFQNHLVQLLTLTALEPPVAFEADPLRDEKVKVLQAIRPAPQSIRGQYRGYRDKADVDDDSQTATYAALKLFVDNWRWHDVPFYLRSGKRLKTKATEVVIQFKHVPPLMFPLGPGQEIPPNVLFLCIQPDEGMHLRFETKKPGGSIQTRSVEMEFHYAQDFGAGVLPDAYERLLRDAIQGDASLFSRADEIELAWKIIDPILAGWQEPKGAELLTYEPGTWGPPLAEQLLGQDGRAWLHACGEHQDRVG